MSKKTLVAGALLALALAVAGCRSLFPADGFVNPHASAGVQHNAGLDFALRRLQEAPPPAPGTRRSREEVLAFVSTAVDQYLDSLNITPEQREAIREANAGAGGLEPALERFRVQEAERGYYRRIAAAVSGEGTARARVAKIQREASLALGALGPDRAQGVLVSAAVAVGSVEYWDRGSNRDAWALAINRNADGDASGSAAPAASKKINWKEVGKADFVGAVRGAVVGAVTGGGIVVGAVSTGLGSSAASVASQLWDKLFS
ncbi:MAG TPA: hypothetical protein VF017_07715 [Thermoanaerobaculia bacterium]|nr:hypothetical protein [Thermoanaerobaculia bacterium]